MNVLIIGSGGREHALADAYSKSTRVKKVFVAPGNDFMLTTSSKIQTLPKINPGNFESVLNSCKKNKIDFVDVAPDEYLAQGLVDFLAGNNIPAFGPTKKAAELEWSKVWSRNFMKKYGLPIPDYAYFNDSKKGIAYIKKHKNNQFYVKASGLAGGKGAINANSKEEAIEAIKKMSKFGSAGKEFLIEEKLIGEEFSLFAICDGENFRIAGSAQDHKNVYNGSLGYNTGGMGCLAPASNLNKSLVASIRRNILIPLFKGMHDEGRSYVGILYLGGIIVKGKVKIIEFNCRWGDPETEVILPGLTTDYADIVQSIFLENLNTVKLDFDKKVRISIAGCAVGYPGDYKKIIGSKIFGLDLAQEVKGVTVYGAGVKKISGYYTVNGGRIFHLVAEGRDLIEARRRAYTAMSNIYIENNGLHYRTDIGWRGLEKITT